MRTIIPTITTVTSRVFNHNAGEAKKATRNGPVFITDRGRPAHVLLSIDEYRRLSGQNQKIADLLAMPDGDFEFEPSENRDLAKAADFS